MKKLDNSRANNSRLDSDRVDLDSVSGGYAVIHVDPNGEIVGIDGSGYSKGSAQPDETEALIPKYSGGNGYIPIELKE